MQQLQFVRNLLFGGDVPLPHTEEDFNSVACRDYVNRHLYALLYAKQVLSEIRKLYCNILQDAGDTEVAHNSEEVFHRMCNNIG